MQAFRSMHACKTMYAFKTMHACKTKHVFKTCFQNYECMSMRKVAKSLNIIMNVRMIIFSMIILCEDSQWISAS